MKAASEALKPSTPPLPLTRAPLSTSPSFCTGLTSPLNGCFFMASAVSDPAVSGSGDSGPTSLVVVSFYKFADFPDHADLRKPLKDLCEELRFTGGIILVPEGINGGICGTQESVEMVLEFVQSDNRLRGLRQIESPATPEDEAIHHGHTSSSPVGAGEDAPFRWDHVRAKLKQEVDHLQGGILKYLEETPESESLWEGECFVFDKQVSVEHGLLQGSYKLLLQQPVGDEDMWELGVTCPLCSSSKSEEEREGTSSAEAV